jgi:hypothetical protein
MKRIHLGLLAATLLASACGGDGGKSFGGTGPVSGSFPIDASNGVAATRQSYGAVMASGGIAEIGGPVGMGSTPPNGAAIANQAATPEDLVLNVVSMIPFGPDVQPCLGGTGTVTMSGDIAVPGTLTAGDFFVIEYDFCDEGAGEVLDGIITLTVRDFSGDLFLGTYLLSMDADIDTLSVATGTDTLIADGDATVTLDTVDAPFVASSVTGTRITQSSNAGTETLSSYSSSQTLDGNQDPAEFTMDAAGSLDSSQLPGSVTYSTESTFRGFVPAYPNEGVLLVRGDSSSARLVVVDDANVRVEIDSNGDGVADDVIDLTWDEFLNAAP